MAEEVHVHQPSNGGGGSAGWVVALLVIVVLAVVLWFVFARGGPDRGVPEKIDVDVNVPSTGN
jgi:hypothetical protein